MTGNDENVRQRYASRDVKYQRWVEILFDLLVVRRLTPGDSIKHLSACACSSAVRKRLFPFLLLLPFFFLNEDCSGKFWVDRECTAACVCVRVGREGLEGSSRDPCLRCVKASCYVIWGGGYSLGRRGRKGAHTLAHLTTESGVHGTRYASRLTARCPDRQPAFADHRATDSDSERLHNRSATLTEDQRILLVLIFCC